MENLIFQTPSQIIHIVSPPPAPLQFFSNPRHSVLAKILFPASGIQNVFHHCWPHGCQVALSTSESPGLGEKLLQAAPFAVWSTLDFPNNIRIE